MKRAITFATQKITNATIKNWITALINNPKFTVGAPAFNASATEEIFYRRGRKIYWRNPPRRRPRSMIGLMMPLVRLPTMVVKAAPIITPTTRSRTLLRETNALNFVTYLGAFGRAMGVSIASSSCMIVWPL